jgi:hypothetical protein
MWGDGRKGVRASGCVRLRRVPAQGAHPIHYYDKTEPTELHSTEFEHNLLRMFSSYGMFRLCTVDTVESCIHHWEVDRNTIGRRLHSNGRAGVGAEDTRRLQQ